MPALALIFQVIDAVDAGTRGPVMRAAAERATAWCTYLDAHARIRPETVRALDGRRPTVRFRINPRLLAGRHARSRRVSPKVSESP